ncbi:MAG: hypothetical protein RBT16_09855 [Desulfococcus multivorans]|jgi:hypothetical protein|nr:hypothetical protein [Desulfococcus multivorans]
MNRKGLLKWSYALIPVFLIAMEMRAGAMENPFPTLVPQLKRVCPEPFQMVGTIQEVGDGRVLFDKKAGYPLQKGQWLIVSQNQPHRSPAMQVRTAWIEVEALFEKTVMARVAVQMKKPTMPNDLVMTPPLPRIYVEKAVGASLAVVHDAIIEDLLEAGFDVRLVEGKSPRSDLQDFFLELSGNGALVCRVTTAPPDRRIIFHENVAAPSLSAVPGKVSNRGTLPTPRPEASSIRQPPEEPSTDYFALAEPYTRVTACDIPGGTGREIACLGQKDLVIFRIEAGALKEISRKSFPVNDVYPLHLHACDLDGNPGDELLVTLAQQTETIGKKDNRLCSWIVGFKDGSLHTLAENAPYYFRVIRDGRGDRIPLAQRQGTYRQYEGPIHRLVWQPSRQRLEAAAPYEPARGVHGIYQFNGVSDDENRIMILEPDGRLHGYLLPEERLAASGERALGAYHALSYPLKRKQDLYLGGFDRKTFDDVYTARRFERRRDFQDQFFTLHSEGAGLMKAIAGVGGAGRQRSGQVVGVKWMGDRIVETWQSEIWSKELLDFTFLEDPSEILVLYRDSDGYALEGIR